MALESAAVANTVLVALVAEQFTVGAVFFLCRLERQFVDRGAAFGTREVECGYVEQLSHRTIAIALKRHEYHLAFLLEFGGLDSVSHVGIASEDRYRKLFTVTAV